MTRPPGHPACRPAIGFTLIEVLVVLVLIGLVSAGVTLQMSSAISRATLADAVTQFESADGLVRQYCRRTGQAATVTVDLDTGIYAATVEGTGEQIVRRALPGQVVFAGFGSKGVEVRTGTFAMRCDESGQTPTIAVGLTHPTEGTKWLIVAGLSGQASPVENEEQAVAILEHIAKDTASGDAR